MNSPEPRHFSDALTEEPSKRQLFSVGELFLLTGMILVVMSASLTWQRTVTQINLPAIPTYVGRRGSLHLGFDIKLGWIRVGWLVVLASVTAASMVLFDPPPALRSRLLGLTYGCSALVMIIAILYAGPFVGPWLCCGGGILMAIGGYFRYR